MSKVKCNIVLEIEGGVGSNITGQSIPGNREERFGIAWENKMISDRYIAIPAFTQMRVFTIEFKYALNKNIPHHGQLFPQATTLN